MMKILVPNNNNLERKYILDQILGEYFRLEYELVFEDANFDYIFINGEKELVVKDVFFNQFPNQLEYLSLSNIPNKVFYAKNKYINDIVFFWGDDVIEESNNRLFCGVDIFASAFFMLTRWEEFILREKTGRCEEQMLLCVKYGLQKRAIVNEYCDVLITLLSKIGIVAKRPIYNQIKITHDVDRCYLSSYRQLFSNLFPLAFRDKQYKKAFIVLKNFLIYKVKRENPFDCFNALMDYSDKYNFINSFYFKTCREGEFGCTYTIDNSFVKKTILNIINRGHEVGFHPSESTFDDDEQFKLEYLRLQAIAGKVIKGGRNHGLYYNINTMRQWNGLLDYDSGFGYQFSNGFRSGICYPYSVFDVFKRETLKLVEIPFVAMDTVAIRTKWTPQELFDDIVDIINIVNKYNGIVCFNWHSNQINVLERKKYKWVYFSIIDFLASKKNNYG